MPEQPGLGGSQEQVHYRSTEFLKHYMTSKVTGVDDSDGTARVELCPDPCLHPEMTLLTCFSSTVKQKATILKQDASLTLKAVPPPVIGLQRKHRHFVTGGRGVGRQLARGYLERVITAAETLV